MHIKERDQTRDASILIWLITRNLHYIIVVQRMLLVLQKQGISYYKFTMLPQEAKAKLCPKDSQLDALSTYPVQYSSKVLVTIYWLTSNNNCPPTLKKEFIHGTTWTFNWSHILTHFGSYRSIIITFTQKRKGQTQFLRNEKGNNKKY